MVQLPQGFDARQIQPASGQQDRLPVSPPEGWTVMITDSSYQVAQSGNGNMLCLEMTIQDDGPMKGKSGIVHFNVEHVNVKAVEIALQHLSAICHCIGVVDANDTSQWYGKPFRVVVVMQSGEDAQAKGYTEVKKYMNLDGVPAHQIASGNVQPQQTQSVPQNLMGQTVKPEQQMPAPQTTAQQPVQQPESPFGVDNNVAIPQQATQQPAQQNPFANAPQQTGQKMPWQN